MEKNVSEITKSASRALSAMYTKCLKAGGMTLEVHKKLYESMVEPVLYYGAEIWGITQHKQIQTVQNKACRYFLGGGTYAANVALRGDMGWNSTEVKAKTEVFRFSTKLKRFSNERIIKTVYQWSCQNRRGWES